MFSSETIIVDSKFNHVYVLYYYDGVKEEVSLNRETIYLWYDYLDDASGEQWLEIVPKSRQLFFEYLSDNIGIRHLINNSMVFICNRLYEKYSEIKRIKKIDNFNGIELPENEFLGYNFLSKVVKKTTIYKSIILKKLTRQILKESINNFSQIIQLDMKLLDDNTSQEECPYLIAA